MEALIIFLEIGVIADEFASVIWNYTMSLVGILAGTTPEEFSSAAWSYVVNDLMSWTLTIGSSLFSSFYLINMLRQTANLKQGITAERFIETGITVILTNYAMLYGTELMSIMFDISGTMSESLLLESNLTIRQGDFDFGQTIAIFVFGLIYMVVALVCSFTILFVVYRRYLKLYAVTGLAPLAWSTIPGGHGISSTASAWLKTFLTYCFEIVVIAVFIAIASKMCTAIDFGDMDGIGEWGDGAIQYLQNMLTMIILAGSVGSAEMFIRRTFGL